MKTLMIHRHAERWWECWLFGVQIMRDTNLEYFSLCVHLGPFFIEWYRDHSQA